VEADGKDAGFEPPPSDRSDAAVTDRVFEVRATAADFVRQYDAHRILPMGNLVSKLIQLYKDPVPFMPIPDLGE
jgi:hypothetical protein